MKKIHFNQSSWRGDAQDDEDFPCSWRGDAQDDEDFPSGKNRAVLEVESDSMIPIEIMAIVHSAIRDFDTTESIASEIRDQLNRLLGAQ